MEFVTNLLPVIGVLLCAMAFGQLALWSAGGWGFFRRTRQQAQRRQTELHQKIQLAKITRESAVNEHDNHWRGWRNFRVDRIEQETANIASVYLVPVDGKPLAHFKPGQHLTFRFQIPGRNKPVVRCYSLSAGPGKSFYRISVKEVPPPRDQPNLPPGTASHYINWQLVVGQVLEIKAPAGDFFLNENSTKPIVLLAGGIGITPMTSILERLIETQSQRLVLLVYGVNQGADHAFKTWLKEINQRYENLHLLTCYSQPSADDRMGVDYQFAGRASAELLQNVLPNPDYEFYLCGPPSFMKSLYDGLLAWGVAREEIRFEAFGPASIVAEVQRNEAQPDSANVVQSVAIKFAQSEVTATWNGEHETLLDFVEAHNIPVDSGCRAGSCGTCATAIIQGSVKYPVGKKPECEPGKCLLCIARPNGPLELGV